MNKDGDNMVTSRVLSNEKGQGLVEFALCLAFVACIFGFSKLGLLQAAESVFDPSAVILGAVDHHRTFDVVPSIENVLAIQANGHYQESTAGANHVNYLRGQMRSGWVDKHPEDIDNNPDIAKLYNEMGATQWTVYNGLGGQYYSKPSNKGFYLGDKGIFWTVQELYGKDLTPHSLKENENYSEELVLEYFYAQATGRYYVIKSHVWVNQGDVANHVALGGFHQQYMKPAGYFVDGCVDGFATLLEAKQLYERVRAENGGSVIFAEPDLEHDVSAQNHEFKLN